MFTSSLSRRWEIDLRTFIFIIFIFIQANIDTGHTGSVNFRTAGWLE